MKHKVSELEGALLDAAVAKAHGQPDDVVAGVAKWAGAFDSFAPSTRWDHGGPIIERERIELAGHLAQWELGLPEGMHVAKIVDEKRGDSKHVTFCAGPTPLIAAMRAYVASKLGDQVELP